MVNELKSPELILWDREIMAEALPLAEGVVLAMEIPVGRGLVPFLAPERSRTNHEAILCWVSDVLESQREDSPDCTVGCLVKLLRARLMEIKEVAS